MRRGRLLLAGAVVAGGLALGACASEGSDAGDKVSDAVDDLAEIGAGAVAKGRWTCETDQVEGEVQTHLTTKIAIGDEGRFSYEVVPTADHGGEGPLVGTWEVDGLSLKLDVPWDDDGRNGFRAWEYDADADPPVELTGQQVDGEARQRFDLDLGLKETNLSQQADPRNGIDYSWIATCTRTSRNPGEIGPTVPASN